MRRRIVAWLLFGSMTTVGMLPYGSIAAAAYEPDQNIEQLANDDSDSVLDGSVIDCVGTKENGLQFGTEESESDFEIKNQILTSYKGNSREVIVPNGVIEIGERAFRNNTAIESLVLPDTVKSIGDAAFQGCKMLNSVNQWYSIETIGSNAFENTGFTTVDFPENIESIFSQAFKNCENLHTAKIYNTFTFANEVFIGSPVKKLEIVASAKSPGFNQYLEDSWGVPEIEELVIGEGITNISFVGSNCRKLKKVQLPSTLYIITDECFKNCTALEEIDLSYVTNIGGSAFSNCSSLRQIKFSDDLESIGQNAFENCSSITSLPLPNSVMNLGPRCFANCTALKDLVIDSSYWDDRMRSIWLADEAFAGCAELERVTLKCKFREPIGERVFIDCPSLEMFSVVQDNNHFNVLDNGVLYEQKKLYQYPLNRSGVYYCISEGTTEIMDYAFSGVKHLQSVYIPESVIAISDSAFVNSKFIKIIGKPGTYAETYAHEQGMQFNAINESSETMIFLVCKEHNDNLGYVEAGSSFMIYSAFIPDTEKTDKVTWTSTHPDVLSVDSTGNAIALSSGDTEVYLTTVDGIKSQVLKFHVYDQIGGNAIDLSCPGYEINMGKLSIGDKLPIAPVFYPPSATTEKYQWYYTNPDVVSVEDGVLWATGEGTTEVYIRTDDGRESGHLLFTVLKKEDLDKIRAKLLLNNPNYQLLKIIEKPHRILVESGEEHIGYNYLTKLYKHSGDLLRPDKVAMSEEEFFELALFDIVAIGQKSETVTENAERRYQMQYDQIIDQIQAASGQTKNQLKGMKKSAKQMCEAFKAWNIKFDKNTKDEKDEWSTFNSVIGIYDDALIPLFEVVDMFCKWTQIKDTQNDTILLIQDIQAEARRQGQTALEGACASIIADIRLASSDNILDGFSLYAAKEVLFKTIDKGIGEILKDAITSSLTDFFTDVIGVEHGSQYAAGVIAAYKVGNTIGKAAGQLFYQGDDQCEAYLTMKATYDIENCIYSVMTAQESSVEAGDRQASIKLLEAFSLYRAAQMHGSDQCKKYISAVEHFDKTFQPDKWEGKEYYKLWAETVNSFRNYVEFTSFFDENTKLRKAARSIEPVILEITQLQYPPIPVLNTNLGTTNANKMVKISISPLMSFEVAADTQGNISAGKLLPGMNTWQAGDESGVFVLKSDTEVITVKMPMTSAPAFGPKDHTFVNTQVVQLNCADSEATIWYLKAGEDTEYQKYTDAFVIDKDTTINAFAVANGAIPSDLVTASYKKVVDNTEGDNAGGEDDNSGGSGNNGGGNSGGSGNHSVNDNSGNSIENDNDAPQATPYFEDIIGHWAKEDIEFVAQNGLFNGTSLNIFDPEGTMTRGMIVTVLSRFTNIDSVKYSLICERPKRFVDVAENVWYYDPVGWAGGLRIVIGTDTDHFSPHASITREAMAVMLYRYAGLLGTINIGDENYTDLTAFNDQDQISGWAKAAMLWCTKNEIFNGDDGFLHPSDAISRAQAAAVIHRFINKLTTNETMH